MPRSPPCSVSPPATPGLVVISPRRTSGPTGPRTSSGGAWRCHAALALVALSHGDSTRGGSRNSGRRSADRPDQSLGIAALAHAYDGDLRCGDRFERTLRRHRRLADAAGVPSYVAGEIDALAGRTDRAEGHYQRASTLSRDSGATFLDAIASVGLVTALASAGRVADALDGYRALIEYWARTGGWIQQWTTLRNLAELLRTVGDEETAVYLEAAADHAPDAPPITDGRMIPSADLPPDRMATLIADAATASRDDVVAVALRALEQHRRTRPPGS